MQKAEQIEKLTMVGLTDNEQFIFIELRKIAMKGGSVKVNYDNDGLAQTFDTYKHYNPKNEEIGDCG